MSSHMVEVCQIEKVEKHPNADRLDIVGIKGWRCITGKDEYVVGDKCIYIPIDSLLDDKAQQVLFPPDSKIKSSRGRIKTIKIRGAISQGMVVKPKVFNLEHCAIGSNVAGMIGVTKWEEPELPSTVNTYGYAANKKQCNPNFHKYTDIENFKNFPDTFTPLEMVAVTEKIHGTNFRCGWVKTVPNTWWKKVKKFLCWLPEWEFVYGSRNVQLQDKINPKVFYKKNVYKEIVENYQLKTILGAVRNKYDCEAVIYGEIYGDGIQKNYSYGCEPSEHGLVVFDVMLDGKYLNWDALKSFKTVYQLPFVPILYVGPYKPEYIQKLARGESELSNQQKIREGVVVKPVIEETTFMGRKILKVINDDYLLKVETTEYH